MADKEATVYIVDVGKTMNKKCNGRDVTNLEWAMQYVWDKITSIMALDRKTTLQGVIGLRTEETSNELSDEESFQNIAVFQDLSQILMPDLRRLHEVIKPSNETNGDAISSLVIAIQMIIKTCKKLKYRRKIILVTDGYVNLEMDQISEIIKKIKEDNIELVILGVDFDDLDYGFKEEDKDPQKVENEEILQSVADQAGGVLGTIAQAIEELQIPRLKTTRPVPSYRGLLTLGDVEKYESSLSIPVERFPRVMIRSPPTASTQVVKVEEDPHRTQDVTTQEAGEGLASAGDESKSEQDSIRPKRRYEIADETQTLGKREVDYEELTKGYEYGRTAVHISESDANITVLETKAGLEIMGFIPAANFPRFMGMSTTNLIIAQRGNSEASMALSSLIHALFELETVAIARFVAKDMKPPLILLLAPSIEPEFECLIDLQLPFAEDYRHYEFPPLDRVLTVSGKELKEHRNLPTKALQSAMDNLINAMDLETAGNDDEGNPAEWAAVGDAFSPMVHRIDQAVRWRAVHPSEPVPPPYPILLKYSKPPEHLVEKCQGQIEKLISVADVKVVPPKTKSRRENREAIKPLSGLDVGGLLADPEETQEPDDDATRQSLPIRRVQQISSENSIPDFRRMLDQTRDPNGISLAAKQLGDIIEKRVTESFGEMQYQRAIEEMKMLREEMRELEEPGLWNDWAKTFKTNLLAEKLGGDRRELWWLMRREKIHLVDSSEEPHSKISPDEARAFLASK